MLICYMTVVAFQTLSQRTRENSDYYLLILPMKVLNNKIKVHSSYSWCPHWSHFTDIGT